MHAHRSVLALALVLSAGALEAQGAPAPAKKPAEPKPDPVTGFIFSAGNILLDIDEYQGGVGVKFLYPDYALRASIGGGYSSADGSLDIAVTGTFEKPFFIGRITPCWGVNAVLGYDQERSAVDADNWSMTQAVSASVGGVLGLEFHVTDAVSFMVEYELAASLAWAGSSSAADGVVTPGDSTVNYDVSTRLGNGGGIAIVLYLEPTGRASGGDRGKK